MTEDEARAWLDSNLAVSRETQHLLERFAALVAREQLRQNLVSATTLATFWARHIVDAAQLVVIAGDCAPGRWLDIGSGAGIPGIVTAILTGAPTILVEPRTRRAAFLSETVDALALGNCRVENRAVEKMVPQRVDLITARAVAALPMLVEKALPFADSQTLWLLPKGKNAKAELASLPRAWQGDWQLHSSVTESDSLILVGRNIRTSFKP